MPLHNVLILQNYKFLNDPCDKVAHLHFCLFVVAPVDKYGFRTKPAAQSHKKKQETEEEVNSQQKRGGLGGFIQDIEEGRVELSSTSDSDEDIEEKDIEMLEVWLVCFAPLNIAFLP